MSESNGQRACTKLQASIDALVGEYTEKFLQIWEAIGYDDNDIELMHNMVLKHTKHLFDEMLEEAENTKNGYITKVEKLLSQAAQLAKELGIKELSNYEKSGLKDVERSLQAKIEEFRAIKQKQMTRLAEYRKKELVLCEELGIPPRPNFPNAVPSDEQLEEYDAYLVEKEEEKEKLMCVYRDVKIAILKLMNELGETPSLDFHKLVVYEDESKFKPTKKNMAMLKEFHQKLENKLEDTKMLALELREKLSLLWERLQEDIHKRESFIVAHQGFSAATIRGLKEEFKRCEELKRQNIKTFVVKIRKELEDWWEKCLTSEEEKSQFLAYKSETYTEDLLEIHELEVGRLKKYYADNIDIFQLAVERQNLWDKMLELERRTNDPNRLFKNRGGQLLREEQERKNIQKELPKIEKELLKYLDMYEMKNGKPFYIEGEKFKNKINQQWMDHKANKESEKSARKARDQYSRMESRIASNLTGAKRKLAVTPHNSTSSKKRNLKGSKSNPSMKKEVQKRVVKVRRRILDRTHSIRGSTDNTSPELAHPIHIPSSSNTTTYSDFQDHLEERNQHETCRSSVAPSRYLRERNIYPPPKSVPLTPKVSNISKGTLKSTPIMPVKPPRKNIGSGQFSTPKAPLTVPRSMRVTPNRSIQQRGGATTPRLTAARGRLPIII